MKAQQRVRALRGGQPHVFAADGGDYERISLRRRLDKTENHVQRAGNPENAVQMVSVADRAISRSRADLRHR